MPFSEIRRVVIVCFILLPVMEVNAQLLKEKEHFPGVREIKTKSYGGSGGSEYWTLKKLDTAGRKVEEHFYQNNRLLSEEHYRYNSHNDETHWIQTYDVNNPERIDTTYTAYEYNEAGVITRQKQTYAKRKDSVVYELSSQPGDTLVYTKKQYYYRPEKDSTDARIYTYRLLYNASERPEMLEIVDLQDNSTKTTYFQYYKNGKLKRKRIVRKPEPEFEPVYVGGPGSDDTAYVYEYYKSGRVKKMYSVVDGKKYKLAKYNYTL